MKLISVVSLVTILAVTACSQAIGADSPAPRLTHVNPDAGYGLLKVTVGLMFVVLAIFASAWFFRRFGKLSHLSSDAIKIVGGMSIGAREKVIVLQVGDEQLLLGVAPGLIKKLHVLESPLPTKNTSIDSNETFQNRLAQAIKHWKVS